MMPVVVQVMAPDVLKFPDAVITAPVEIVTGDAMMQVPVAQVAVPTAKVRVPLNVHTTSAAEVMLMPEPFRVNVEVPAKVTVALVAEGLAICMPATLELAVNVTT